MTDDLIIVRDQAFTLTEYAAWRRRRDRDNARHRERMATDPAYRERVRNKWRRWRDRNHESYNAYHREWMRRKRAAA